MAIFDEPQVTAIKAGMTDITKFRKIVDDLRDKVNTSAPGAEVILNRLAAIDRQLMNAGLACEELLRRNDDKWLKR